MEFGKDHQSRKLMWKEGTETGGGTVHISENAKIVVGNYECQETDKIEVSENHIAILAGGEPSHLTRVDIDTVMKGETAFDFLCKCISNPRAFSHFLDHTSSNLVPQEERKELLRRARITGRYRAAIELEQRGVSLKDEDAQHDQMMLKIKELEKKVQALSKDPSSVTGENSLRRKPHRLLSLFKRKSN